jgi:hypothetical protein
MNMKGNAKLRKERETEIVNILIISVLAVVFTLGVVVGKEVAIKDARLVEENASSYVLSFGESEHLYLRDDVVNMYIKGEINY